MRYGALLITLLVTIAASSQKGRFDEGYIVMQTGEKHEGLVYWKKEIVSTDSVQFKKTESDLPQSYAWTQLQDAYNKENKRKVKVATVMRNYEYIDANDYMIRNKDSVGMQVIPLTQLYDGVKLSLYLYHERSPFYFIYDGKEMKQLVQKYRYANTVERMFDYEKGRRFHITDQYRGLLATYYDFSQDSKLRYMLQNTLYDQGSLRALIAKMNDRMQ